MHAPAIRSFSRLCEDDAAGGFSKTPDAAPDPLHTYMSISGFALTAPLMHRAEPECAQEDTDTACRRCEGGGGEALDGVAVDVQEQRLTKELCAALGMSRGAARLFCP